MHIIKTKKYMIKKKTRTCSLTLLHVCVYECFLHVCAYICMYKHTHIIYRHMYLDVSIYIYIIQYMIYIHTHIYTYETNKSYENSF